MYYSIMRISPVVMDDLLLIILTIPLTDQSLQMDLYKVHNLPALHPDLKIQFSYELEGEYLALSKAELYAALPTPRDIQICMATEGYLCLMNQALYPVDRIEWCVYALFRQKHEHIAKYCMINTKIRHVNYAQSLDGYMWAISPLTTDKLQIRCLTETSVEIIKPPLQIVYIGNGCEGYSPNVYIPAKSELTSTIDTTARRDFFISFNEKYENMSKYGIWYELEVEQLTPEEMETLPIRLTEFPPMVLNHLKKRIKPIDPKNPWSIHPNLVLFLLIGTFIFWVIVVIIIVWQIYLLRSHVRGFKPMTKLFFGPTNTTATELIPLQQCLVDLVTDSTSRLPQTVTRPLLPAVPELPKTPPRDPCGSLPALPPPQTPKISKIKASSTTLTPEVLQKAADDLVQEGVNLKGYQKYLAKKYITDSKSAN